MALSRSSRSHPVATSELLTKGLIDRSTDATIKQAKVLPLTPTGRRILKRTIPLFIKCQSTMLAVLTDEEKEAC